MHDLIRASTSLDLEAFRKAATVEALRRARGHRAAAARMLGVSPAALYRWVTEPGIAEHVPAAMSARWGERRNARGKKR